MKTFVRVLSHVGGGIFARMTQTMAIQVPPADRFDVVIAGAGLIGLALARALALGLPSGARIAIVARAAPTGLAADSRAVALSAASVRMLQRLGAWDACRPLAQPVVAIDITDSRLEAGIRPVLLSYDNVVGVDETASYIVPNTVLDAALAACVAQSSVITRFDGATVASFVPGPEATIMELSDGHTLAARLLVAADGRTSPLRAQAGIQTVGWPYSQTGITVMVDHSSTHEGHAVQHFLPGGPFAILPLPGNRSCITWSEERAVAARSLALDDAAFLEEIETRIGGRLGTISLAGPRQSWPLELFVARRFVAERFALVGDAAHAVHPIAGQGLNLGLRDVAALAETIVDTARVGLDFGTVPTLQSYEQWRRFETVTSAVGFDAINRLFTWAGRLPRAAREFGLGLVDRTPPLKQRLVAQAAGVAGDLPRLLRGEAL
jgi:2-octaprenyl-6-methoxyphenol hydroxylase